MAEPEATLRESVVDFDSAIGYALQPVMRRLIIVYIVGTLLLPVGLTAFIDPAGYQVFGNVVERVLGLALAVVGATLLFGGLVGAVFKLVADANSLAAKQVQ